MTNRSGNPNLLPDPAREFSSQPRTRGAYPEWLFPVCIGGSLAIHVLLIVIYSLLPPKVDKPAEQLIEIDLRDTEKKPPVPKVLEAKKPPEPKPKPEVKTPPKPPRVAMRPQPERKPPEPKPQPEVKPKPEPKPRVVPEKERPRVLRPPQEVQPVVKKPVAKTPVAKTPAVQPPRVAVTTPRRAPGEAKPAQNRTATRVRTNEPPQRIAGLLRNPAPGSGAPRAPGRTRLDEQAGAAPGDNTPGRSIDKPRPGTRPRDIGSNPFDDPSTARTDAGGQNNSTQEPLPRGARFGRRDAGDMNLAPGQTNSRSYGAGIPGGGSSGAGSGNEGGSARGRNPELAGTDGAGGINLPHAYAKRGGGGRSNPDVFAYTNPNDNNRIAMNPNGSGPGSGGGQGGGRGGGAGRDSGRGVGSGGNLDIGAIRTKRGTGLGAGAGGGIGGAPGRSRGGAGEFAGGGGTGGGYGGGTGSGLGTGRGRGGGGRNRPLYAGVPFGDPNGSSGGNANGGGGRGGGPGGPGTGTRLARGGSGPGDGDGNGAGRGPGGTGSGDGTGDGRGAGGFGRGPGSGIGRGSGDGLTGGIGGGNGSGGLGRGNRGGDGEAGGESGSARIRRLNAERAKLQREREAEELMGRGIWGALKAEFFQDTSKHPETPGGGFGPGSPIDWKPFSDSKFKRDDKLIDFNWGEKPPVPGLKHVYWSARWTGKIFVPKDDTYEFYFDRLDDAGRLFLDGDKIIEVWQVQQSTPVSKPVRLKRGVYPIVVEYVQGPATEASISLSWKSSSFAKELVGIYRPND